jgi:Flp pilus assembly protein TadG
VVLPLLLILMLNIINFGLFIYGWISVSDAARVAAEYQVYNGVVVGSNGSPPSFSSVQSVANADLTALPGNPSVTVQVQSMFNGTATCLSASCSYTAQADPEPTKYKSYTIDVFYTFTPVASALNLISPSTIHKQVVMRAMQ